MKKKLLFLIILMSVSFIDAQDRQLQKAETYLNLKGEVNFSFIINSASQLDRLTTQMSILNFDPATNTVYAWANTEQFRRFQSRNIDFQINEEDNFVGERRMSNQVPLNQRMGPYPLTFPLTAYPTYSDYALQMQEFATNHPAICELVDIGGTTEGVGGGDKRLLFIKLSDNVSSREQEPRIMYTSSMHGDEISGYPMMLELINYLITAYEDTGHSDHLRVKNLIDNSEIWINPSANPDGTYYNDPTNTSVANARRANDNGWDLNRNYPDNVAGAHPDGNSGYELETQHFMTLADNNHFVLSANFHGGTEVVNYPWDNTYTRHPDDEWFFFISKEYAVNCQDNSPNGYMDATYTNYVWPGVTNGADWYRVEGGRQDYMNYYQNCKESTIELSNVKTIAASLLDDHWNYNQEALIEYLIQGTYGFQGVVKDAVTSNPINATITLVGHDDVNSNTITELPLGDYYRPTIAGTYDILFEADCYQPFTLTSQTIANYETLVLADVMLTPIGALPPAGLAASNLGGSSATLSWNEITGASYDYRYRQVGSSPWTTINTNSFSVDLTGLNAGTSYEAEVRSICGTGTSAYSNSITFTTTNTTLISGSYFESGFDGWTDGGNDCARVTGSSSYEGNYSIRLRDNSGTSSSMTSPTLDLSSFEEIEISFYFYPNSMENNEDFWLRYNDGSGWVTVATYVSGSDFSNGSFYNKTLTLSDAQYNLSSNAQFRFQCDASGNNDQIYIDEVIISATASGPDTIIPVITLNGSSTIDLNVGGTYTEQGASATDNIDGDLSGSIVIGGDVVNTSIGGSYVVTYNVNDSAGNNAAEVTRTINVIPDTTAPVITLIGSSTINLNVGGTYTEQGATATDNIDGDISGSIIIGGDVVTTALAGTYLVTYNVSDAAGNNAAEVIRTVNVIPDTTAPVITLTGSSTINLNVGGTYTEQGASATDNNDGDISGSIVIAGDVVDGNTAGTYIVTYNVSDTAGNNAVEVIRTVNVAPDITNPVITLIGSSTINLDEGGTYTEQGASATDNIDGDISGSIVIAGDTVDGNTSGVYVVTYNVSDAAGNNAIEVSRTVNVIPDTTAPVITLNGSSTFNLDEGGTYIEQGATATDNIDGDISGSIVIAGDTVDGNTAGAYLVTYNVSDAAGNNAVEVTRTVNVIPDTTAPVITLIGNITIDLDVGDTYVELGATATDNIDGDISGSVVIAGDAVDENTVGTYVVTYNVSDAAGNNAAQVSRTVNVNEVSSNPVILNQGYFESGLDGWTDGGSDCARVSTSNYSYEGLYSIRIRDNSGTSSSMTLSNIDMTLYAEVEVSFYFYARSMENNEDFWMRYYNGSTWNTVETYISGSNINNNTFYNATIYLSSAQYNLAANSALRFQCDASANNDQIYMDQITVTGYFTNSGNSNSLVEVGSARNETSTAEVIAFSDIKISPNPVNGDILNIHTIRENNFSYRIFDMTGKIISAGESKKEVHVGKLERGMYFIEVSNEGTTTTKKFIKQ